MRILLLVSLLLTGGLAMAAETAPPSPVSAFETGNEAYASGNYSEAAAAYREQMELTGPNATLLFNLGNAHYRLGEYGPAILAYERALVLDPHAEDIRANLRQAREATTAFEEHHPAVWEAPLYWLGLDEWLAAGLISLFILAVISLLNGFLGDRTPRNLVRLAGGASVILLAAATLAVSLRYSELRRGIVVTPGAKVRLSPFPTADVVATLPAGRTIQCDRTHDGFIRIEKGWIAETDAAPIYLLFHRDSQKEG